MLSVAEGCSLQAERHGRAGSWCDERKSAGGMDLLGTEMEGEVIRGKEYPPFALGKCRRRGELSRLQSTDLTPRSIPHPISITFRTPSGPPSTSIRNKQ
jgi:hypothetical protein